MAGSRQVVVVTGGAGGIGSEIVRAFAATGAAVVVNDYGVSIEGDAPNEAPAQALVDEIVAGGGEAAACFGSVSDFEFARSLVRFAVDTYGSLDVIVTCHGVFRPESIFDLTEEDFDVVVENHLKGTFNCVHHAALQMREQRSGSIIGVVSTSGFDGNPNQANYSAAKAGTVGLLFATALAAGEFDINVNGIIPAAATRVTDRPGSQANLWWGDNKPDAKLSAALTVALASPAARHITGQVFSSTGDTLGLWSHSEEVKSVQRTDWTPALVVQTIDGALSGPPLRRFGVLGLAAPQRRSRS
jgi:NAD(P)-dependent dehydrogenase (short-subunit alcohol dehydrogenase family)